MPKGATKEYFEKIKHCYNDSMFRKAGTMIRDMARQTDDMHIEERIARIAEIFGYFKNPDKETVLTPWPVVNIHMSETLGGYCFFDETFKKPNMIPALDSNGKEIKDENGDVKLVETKYPRLVGESLKVYKDIFENIDINKGESHTKILEINSKTGLYPLYVAYSLYRPLLDLYKDEHAIDDPDNIAVSEERAIWNMVIKNNIYVICNTDMAARITYRTLAGYNPIDDVDTSTISKEHYVKGMHIKSDRIIERVKENSENLVTAIQTPDYWNDLTNKTMIDFNAVVGNPPYQGTNHQQLYPYFYMLSKELGQYVSLIFPVGWQEPKTGNNLAMMNSEEIKSDEQIHFVDNRHNIFPGVSGVEWTNFLFWERGFSNGLDGKQKILTDGVNPVIKKIAWETEAIEKPQEIKIIGDLVTKSEGFKSLQKITSVLKPYGFRTDVIGNHEKYGLEPIFDTKNDEDDLVVFAKGYKKFFIPKDYNIPRLAKAYKKYKVFVPYAWGNMSENYLGGAFSDIVVARPYDVCTETFQESGCFDDFETAFKHAKFLMTKFARALLFVNKRSQHSTTAWGAVPVQDYTEEWWSEPISSLENHLFDKYNVPKEIRAFVLNNFQTKDETNIIIS